MAMQLKYDDGAWRPVDVPHDWSIEGPFNPAFASGTGFAPGGIGWYRRHLAVDGPASGRRVTLELDGVYDNAEVWLNGNYVGGRPYGFESFTCDLTPVLNYGGADNVLAIRVDHSRFSDSRWYTGSGIIRNVRLCITGPVHLGHWGTFVATPSVTASSAAVVVETEVDNESDRDAAVALESDLVGPDGQVAASGTASAEVGPGGTRVLRQQIDLPRPVLWSPDAPALYTLRSRLSGAGSEIDATATPFGVRTAVFDADRGFLLNGVPTKLKGVCLHEDGGSVGAAIPPAIWDRRLRALKDLGVNAIRTSHNPPAPEFLDLCDSLGFLVMDEAFDEFTPAKNKWVVGWNQGVPSRYGYSEHFAEWSVRDAQDMVRRDRNHPSIVMWSIGNEIDYPNDPFTDPALGAAYKPGNPPGTDMVRWGRPLVAAVKGLDPTRPVTAALASLAMSNAVGFAQILDVDGYNYQESRYDDDHRQYPRRIIYGSENKHTYAAWAAVLDHPFVAGQFLWTGIDYLGEARAWPMRASPDGLLDLCGFVKPLGRFRESLWGSKPMVYLCASPVGQTPEAAGSTDTPTGEESWNWPAGTQLRVSCYSNCQDVALSLNGLPLGTRRSAQAVDGVRTWTVDYAPGVLRAIGRSDGASVARFSLETAGPAVRIVLRPDRTELRAGGTDISQVEFDVVDAQGIRVPDASQELTFSVVGPARIIGLGNGDIANREPVKGSAHRAYQGRGLAIFQTTSTPGPITIRAFSPELQPATIALVSR
jgi:beta-galactosidase